MESSMRSRIDGTDKATASVHMDFGDDEMGYMVEYRLMVLYHAKELPDFANAINSPGLKKYQNASKETRDIVDAYAKQMREEFESKKRNSYN